MSPPNITIDTCASNLPSCRAVIDRLRISFCNSLSLHAPVNARYSILIDSGFNGSTGDSGPRVRSNLDDRKGKKGALIPVPSARGTALYTLPLGPLIYYRPGRDIFDVSVGKIKAILLAGTAGGPRDREPKAAFAHGNRRCRDTNMRALIESRSTHKRCFTSCACRVGQGERERKKVSVHADVILAAACHVNINI